MKIDQVEAVNLCYAYPGEGGFTYSGGVCTRRATTLVLVHADSGEVGLGSVYSHPGLVHLIVEGQLDPLRVGAVDIVQPDASRCGGISEVWRVGQLAHEHGLRVATHSWSDAVAVVANAHAVGALPNGITVEVDRTSTPFIEELLVGGLRISDGLLELGDAPGLGIELDMEVVERLRMEDPLAMPDGLYSDMAFGESRFGQPPPYEES